MPGFTPRRGAVALVGLLVVLGAVGCRSDRSPRSADGDSATAATPVTPPDEVTWRRAVPYGSDPAQVMDLYVPDETVPSPTGTPDARPTIVLVHGGGWTDGSRSSYHQMATSLAAIGWVAASVDYRLAPGVTHPAEYDDVAAALRHVVDDADLPVDDDRVVLAGDSAGGHLTGLVALDDAGPPVAAWVSWSGVYDIPLATSAMDSEEADIVADRLFTYLGCSDRASAACAEVADAASPVHLVSPDDPPTLLLQSTDEIIPLVDARAMRDALRDAGVRVRLETWPGPAHGLALLPQAQEVVSEFLTDVLGLPG